MPWVLTHVPCVGEAYTVLAAGKDLANLADLCFPEGVQLSDFYDPCTTNRLCHLRTLKRVDGVREPCIPCQLAENGALANALRADEDTHLIELAARGVRTVHAAQQSLACSCTGRRVVLCAKVIDKQGVDAGHAIPNETVQVLHNPVAQAGFRHITEGIKHNTLSVALDAILPLKIGTKTDLIWFPSPGAPAVLIG